MIENTSLIVNLVANLVTLVCMTMFYIYLFGDHNKMVAKWSFVSHWTLRMGIIGMIAGTFFNTLTLSTPDWSEITLNCGLALLMFWALLFHRKMFLNSSTTQTK